MIRPSSPFPILVALAFGLGLLPPAPAGAQAGGTEYQIKAAFLFNFAQFVEWPEAAFESPDAPLVIGILGDDPFGAALDGIVRGEKVGGHPLVVHRFAPGEPIDCHILFVVRSERGHLPQVLAGVKSRSVLTVGETEGFAEGGGMIGFVTDRDRIRLAVNLAASDEGGLKLSSKLLRAARIVTPGGV